MPKIDAVASLIRAIGTKDYATMRVITEQLIAHERAAGRDRAATMLERSLRSWPNTPRMVELPHAIKPLVWPEATLRRLTDLCLDEDLTAGVNQFLHERRHYAVIHEAGLPVRKSILLAGPPGNGKTSLASALANELNLQFVSVKLYALIDSHMGASSRNLGKVFEHAMTNDCLLFLDEFDAIGSQRIKGAENSGREMNNIVTTLLTNIDRLPDTGVLIAATNMLEAIDPAIQRRFDMKIWMAHPTSAHIARYITLYQETHAISFGDASTLACQLEGSSWSAVEQTCIARHKELILGPHSHETGWIGRQDFVAM